MRSIELSPEERHELERFTRTGKRSVNLVKRAAAILAQKWCLALFILPVCGSPLSLIPFIGYIYKKL
jgi:hypothetical protein